MERRSSENKRLDIFKKDQLEIFKDGDKTEEELNKIILLYLADGQILQVKGVERVEQIAGKLVSGIEVVIPDTNSCYVKIAGAKVPLYLKVSNKFTGKITDVNSKCLEMPLMNLEQVTDFLDKGTVITCNEEYTDYLKQIGLISDKFYPHYVKGNFKPNTLQVESFADSIIVKDILKHKEIYLKDLFIFKRYKSKYNDMFLSLTGTDVSSDIYTPAFLSQQKMLAEKQKPGGYEEIGFKDCLSVERKFHKITVIFGQRDFGFIAPRRDSLFLVDYQTRKIPTEFRERVNIETLYADLDCNRIYQFSDFFYFPIDSRYFKQDGTRYLVFLKQRAINIERTEDFFNYAGLLLGAQYLSICIDSDEEINKFLNYVKSTKVIY